MCFNYLFTAHRNYLFFSLIGQEEFGLSYEVKEYERGADFFAPEELKKVHPLGKIPILIDGEDTIAESGTIVG